MLAWTTADEQLFVIDLPSRTVDKGFRAINRASIGGEIPMGSYESGLHRALARDPRACTDASYVDAPRSSRVRGIGLALWRAIPRVF